jgi:hypothetical protein
MIIPRRVARDDRRCPGSNRAVPFLPRWDGHTPCGYGLQPVSAAACASAAAAAICVSLPPEAVTRSRRKYYPGPLSVLHRSGVVLRRFGQVPESTDILF